MQVEIIVPLGFFLTAFGIVYLIFSTRHKERMKMIERGVDADMLRPNDRKSKHAPLKHALTFIGVGLGLFVGSMLDEFLRIGEVGYFAMTFFFGGIGLLLYYLIYFFYLRFRDEEDY